jgi:hypothetical protein
MRGEGGMKVRGVSHDNGKIVKVSVNGKNATLTRTSPGVADWEISFKNEAAEVVAGARDEAGNEELTPHKIRLAEK